jgi:hypothetical protein
MGTGPDNGLMNLKHVAYASEGENIYCVLTDNFFSLCVFLSLKVT